MANLSPGALGSHPCLPLLEFFVCVYVCLRVLYLPLHLWGLCPEPCRILFPQPGIEPSHPAVATLAPDCASRRGKEQRAFRWLVSPAWLPTPHHALRITQTHVHRVSDAIQPSHPLSYPSPPAPNPSQHQSLFQ